MLVAALVATACAQTPDYAAEERREIAAWLADEPRTISVVVRSRYPATQYVTQRSVGGGPGGAIGGAVTGALLMPWVGLESGDPTVLALSVLFIPVGMVAGAVVGSIAETETVGVEPLADHGAAGKVIAALADTDLAAALGDQVIDIAHERTRHLLIAIPPSSKVRPKLANEIRLTISLSKIAFKGDDDADPSAHFSLSASTALNIPLHGRRESIEYQSDKKRRLSEWAADDAKLFREELRRAMRSVAEKIVDEMLRDEDRRSPCCRVAAGPRGGSEFNR